VAGARRFSLPVGGKGVVGWEWGAGPTVLLVHGWSGNGAQMSPFVAPLVAAGFHVVTFDQPAHGHSEGKRTTVLELRDAVTALARRTGPVHAAVAHSLGATATVLALAAGAPIERAVLLAPPAESPYFVRAFARKVGLSEAGVEAVVARLRALVGPEVGALDVRPLVAALRTPLLVMHDREDREVPFSHGSSIAAASPAARFVALSGLGHQRLLRDGAVIEQALAFIADSAPPPARDSRHGLGA
jgi:pimeloyl-ACP methyl ester carboxylesterase